VSRSDSVPGFYAKGLSPEPLLNWFYFFCCHWFFFYFIPFFHLYSYIILFFFLFSSLQFTIFNFITTIFLLSILTSSLSVFFFCYNPLFFLPTIFLSLFIHSLPLNSSPLPHCPLPFLPLALPLTLTTCWLFYCTNPTYLYPPYLSTILDSTINSTTTTELHPNIHKGPKTL
jgi:hypothetical protein